MLVLLFYLFRSNAIIICYIIISSILNQLLYLFPRKIFLLLLLLLLLLLILLLLLSLLIVNTFYCFYKNTNQMILKRKMYQLNYKITKISKLNLEMHPGSPEHLGRTLPDISQHPYTVNQCHKEHNPRCCESSGRTQISLEYNKQTQSSFKNIMEKKV